LLGFLQLVGCGMQNIGRVIATFLIGSSAQNWSLATLPRTHKGFKEQRANRERVGGLTVFVLVMPVSWIVGGEYRRYLFPIVLIMGGLLAAIAFAGLVLLRNTLESRAEPEDKSR